MYSVPLFETKTNTIDEIPLAFFTLKISRPTTVGQYKVCVQINLITTIQYRFILIIVLFMF